MYEILNKQVKFLTSQYIGTCKSAYTKGLCPKLSTNRKHKCPIERFKMIKNIPSNMEILGIKPQNVFVY